MGIIISLKMCFKSDNNLNKITLCFYDNFNF